MKYILGFTLLILSMHIHAGEASKREKLVELLNVMDMDAMLNTMYSHMEEMMQNVSVELGVQPSEQPIFDQYYSKMTQVMREAMSWKKMEPKMIELYERNFNEKQISDMLAFYKTDTGKAILAKMPVVTQESMRIGQSLMQEAVPKIQEVVQQLADDLQKARQPKE
jgi:hypothetical protein